MEIRPERPEDIEAIRTLTIAAFKDSPHSSQTEAAIIDALRRAGVLTVSLVAIQGGDVAGHVAFSPVTIDGKALGWYGLGPVSVWPNLQRRGIGQALIWGGLDHLKRMNAQGCVVLGDPSYYRRFGFICDHGLRYGAAPSEYFQRLAFGKTVPKGCITLGSKRHSSGHQRSSAKIFFAPSSALLASPVQSTDSANAISASLIFIEMPPDRRFIYHGPAVLPS